MNKFSITSIFNILCKSETGYQLKFYFLLFWQTN